MSCLVYRQFHEAHMGSGEGHPPEGRLDPSLCVNNLIPSPMLHFQATHKRSFTHPLPIFSSQLMPKLTCVYLLLCIPKAAILN